MSAKAPLPIPSKSNKPTMITRVVSLNNPIEVFTIDGIDILIAALLILQPQL